MSRMPRVDPELHNPCYKEQNLSFKCLNDNNYDGEKCEIFFQNYKYCKEFWGKIQRERRRDGLTPALPKVEDRERIKEEYLASKRLG